MFDRLLKGKTSLSETFWQYSVLGITICGFIVRFLMIKFKQTVGYIDFFEHFLRNLARYRTDTWTIAMLLLYGACFAGLLLYCGMCIRAMYLNYKDYEKSKILAMICLFLTLIISYIAIKSSLY
jgi:hypothetical protein